MPEPTTPTKATLDTAAITIHELFASYVRAGFMRQEALQIVIGMNSDVMRNMKPGNGN